MHFSQAKQEKLELLLDSDQYPEVLGFSELHGFLCALIVGPESLNQSSLLSHIFYAEENQDLSKITDDIINLIQELYQDIQQTLFSSTTLLLPCLLSLNEESQVSDSLEEWAMGFFEAHLLFEKQWYDKDEELIAEMLIPLLMCIDNEDEPTFEKIRSNVSLFENLIKQLPQALQDLYLFYHADDK